MSRARTGAVVAGLVAGGLSALAWLRYRRDLRRSLERISAGRVIDTSSGPIEYGMAGDGPPVLAVHGAGGGFDQGLEIAEPLAERGYRIVAMSRFGYLRTPLPADASPAAQADAHAALLDALGIPRVVVAAASAGAPSSMQFALRHPDRTAALVLLVPAAHPFRADPRPESGAPQRMPGATKVVFDVVLDSDFLCWTACRTARGAMVRSLLGTPPSAVRHASAGERARIGQLLDHLLPVSRRRAGLVNDLSVVRSLPRYDLERIAAPTLVVGVEDCLYGTWPGARYTAQHVPGARFVGYETGGHLWVGHQRELLEEVVGFLRDQART